MTARGVMMVRSRVAGWSCVGGVAVVLSCMSIGAWAQTIGEPTAATAPAEPDPQASYAQSGLAAEEATVRASRDGADDVAFVGKLMQAAASVPARPRLRALLCDKVLDLAAADPTGQTLLTPAAQALAEADPSRGTADELLLGAVERAYVNARTTRTGFVQAAASYARQTERVGDLKAAAGDCEAAAQLYTKAIPLYRQSGTDRHKPLAEKIVHCRQMAGAAAREEARRRAMEANAARLEAAVTAARADLSRVAGDAAARGRLTAVAVPLARLLALEFDDHQRAVGVARGCGDETIERVIPLLGREAATLEAAEALAVGRWLAEAVEDASLSEEARRRCIERALPALARYIETVGEGDLQRWAVQQQHEQLAARLASLDAAGGMAEGMASVDAALLAKLPADAQSFGGHSYKMFTQPLNWHEAKAACEAMGGSLVCIADEAEAAFVADLGRGQAPWIGLTAEGTGRWRWVDGAAMTHDGWKPGGPDNGSGQEFYAFLRAQGDRGDGAARWERPYVCEWSYERPAEEAAPAEIQVEPSVPTVTAPPAAVESGREPAVEPATSEPRPASPWPTPNHGVTPAPAPDAPAPPVVEGDDEPMPGEMFPGVKWRDDRR